MVLNHLKKVPHLTPVRKHVMRKNRTPTQLNAKTLLRQVHAAEEGVGAGVEAGADRIYP